MKVNIIYLTGFMACGKSTIGPIVANTLGWEFFDLDKVIEKVEGISVTKIFETKGEEYFRTKENEVLHRLSGYRDAVIALGGGTAISEVNMKILKETGKLIYLKSSPEILFKRLHYKKDRPVLNPHDGKINQKEFVRNKINQLLKEREPFYERADFIIQTDQIPLGITVDKIVQYYYKKIHEKNKSAAGR
jgi:shikimate kinase